MPEYRLEYWTVEVEADAHATDAEACDWATQHVREEVARIHRTPALWTAWVVSTGYYRVIRVRRKTHRE